METKFQSSFIPKGPIVSEGGSGVSPVKKQRSILGFIASAIFGLSVLAAGAAVGYKFYLDYSTDAMATELEVKRSQIEEETVAEILRLNNRLLASEDLINSHITLSPLFDFLELSTLQSVRFVDFAYEKAEGAPRVSMRGQARSYTALALQADVLNKSKNFINPVFSDVSLDEVGNVTFSFEAELDPNLISYRREVERATAPIVPVTEESATSTATSTPSGTGTTTPTGGSTN